jgi:hypothetical protein
MIHKCDRCLYETDKTTNLKKHLSTKNICEDKNHCGLSREEILKSLEKDKTDYEHTCSFCNEKYQSNSGKYKHELTCKIIQENITLKIENIALKNLLKNSNINNTIIENQQNNITNNNINQQNIYNNITINCCGNENTSHLTDVFLIQCIKKGMGGVCDLINKLNFHPDYPENHNIRNINDTCYQVLEEQKITSMSRYMVQHYKLNGSYKNNFVYSITKEYALKLQLLQVTETIFKEFINKCPRSKIGQKNIEFFITDAVFPLCWSMNLDEENDLDYEENEEQQKRIFEQLINSIDQNGTKLPFI